MEQPLWNNAPLACVHAGQFDGLSALRILYLSGAKLGNIRPDHFGGWSLDPLETLELGDDLISWTSVDFQAYKSVLPALVEGNIRVRGGDGMSDPICGSIAADTNGSGFHATVRVKLEHSLVHPNRVRLSGTSGDGFCGSQSGQISRNLWTWQRSADGAAWADMPSDRQPPGYGARAKGECSFTYTPHTDDNTMYVRAYVPVSTSTELGDNNYHSAAFGPLNVQ